MTTHVHFVGSIGLDSTDDVFNTVGGALKANLKRCPDGETGGRRLWVSYQWPVLRATGFLLPASDQAFPGMGLCPLKLKDGVRSEDIRFNELGYAREARTSYQDFLVAKKRGVLDPSTRFQVSLPTPIGVIGSFVVPQDVPKVLPAYEQAMLAEVGRICAAIPHSDLAIQWDTCIEMIQWDGRVPFIPPYPHMEEAVAAAVQRWSAAVPEDVELGFHLCYGDMDAKHFVEPVDLTKAVELANLILANAKRPVTWIHMPVPIDRNDAAYFAPLKNLHLGKTELFLGLVHLKDGVEGTVKRMKAAAAFIPNFGIATECGIGRARTIEMVRGIVEVHAGAAKLFEKQGAVNA